MNLDFNKVSVATINYLMYFIIKTYYTLPKPRNLSCEVSNDFLVLLVHLLSLWGIQLEVLEMN